MKALLVLAAVALTSACPIPTRYAQASTAATTNAADCTAISTGYKVSTWCADVYQNSGLAAAVAPVIIEAVAGTTTINNLDPTNELSNDGTTASAFPGQCIAPATNGAWWQGATTAIAATITPFGAAATETCNVAPAVANVYTAGAREAIGLNFACDEANNYYVSNGAEGAVACNGKAAAVSTFYTTLADDTSYFQGQNGNNAVSLVEGGATQLRCNEACTLPVSLCNPTTNAISPFIEITNGKILNGCRVAPTPTGAVNVINFKCANSKVPFTFTCNANAGTAAAPLVTSTAATTYVAQCANAAATASGASLAPRFGYGSPIASLTQAAGLIKNFPLVTSSIVSIDAAANAQAKARYWNNNPAQPFVSGAQYYIDVVGCTGADQTQCVQQTLNWWRCEHDIRFNSGDVCVANGFTQIACPVHETGFRCDSSSKKGLLGLLGLLGIIPLVLLICCSLFLCCIRRKKTEADVHFATFDPNGVPMAGVATATAVPTGSCYGPTFAGAPSAVPVF